MAVSFCVAKTGEFMKEKTIYCPICGRKAMTYDGKAKTPIDAACKKCRKRIIYFPKNGATSVKCFPKRNCGSGTRIWF